MLDKRGSTQEEFLALLGFGTEDEQPKPRQTRVRPAAPATPPEPEPTPESEPESEPDDWGFHTPIESIPVEQALRGEAPAATEPGPTPEPEGTDLPDWMDPSWVLPEESEVQLSEEEISKLPQFDFLDFPEATPAPAKPAPKSIPDLDVPKPEVAPTLNVDEAVDFFLELEGINPELDAAVDTIRGTEEIIITEEDQKTKANAIGLTIGTLEVLLKKPGVMGDKRKEIEQAARTLINYYSDEAGKLPKEYQERVNNKIIRRIEGPKKRPLQRRSSQWHSENTIYTRNRAIEIIRNEDVSVEDAEAQAQDEWNRIIEVTDTADEFSDTDKKNLQIIFGKKVLGSGDFDGAEKEILDIIARGPGNKGDTFYQDVNIDDIDMEEALSLLTSAPAVDEDIEDMPEEYVQKLTPQILEFGQLAQNLWKVGEDWKDRLKEGGLKISDMSGNAMAELQNRYNKLVNLGIEIANTPTEIKVQAFEDGEIFKRIFAVTGKINELTDVFGIESLERTDAVSGAELEEGNLFIIDPTKKKPKKEEGGKPRERNKETEDMARERWLNIIKSTGRLEDYYKKKREYHKGPVERKRVDEDGDEKTYTETQEQFEARRNPQEELRRIRTADRNQINREVLKWRELGFKRGDPDDFTDELKKIIEIHNETNRRLFERIAKSWLEPKKLAVIEEERLNDRIKKLTETLSYFKKHPRQANFYIKKALEHHLENVPKMWEKAKKDAEGLVVEKFEPGIWTEEQLKTKKRVAQILDMADLFCKNIRG